MENASKALIIAGAILISILLISVGVLIMSGADGMTETMGTTMNQQEIDAFNQPFLTYESTNQTANNVKALISKIASSNTTNDALVDGDEKRVELNATINGTPFDEDNTDAARAAVTSTRRYTVTCTIDANTGLVDMVTITTN